MLLLLSFFSWSSVWLSPEAPSRQLRPAAHLEIPAGIKKAFQLPRVKKQDSLYSTPALRKEERLVWTRDSRQAYWQMGLSRECSRFALSSKALLISSSDKRAIKPAGCQASLSPMTQQECWNCYQAYFSSLLMGQR